MNKLRFVTCLGIAAGWCILVMGGVVLSGVSPGNIILGVGLAAIGASVMLGIGASDF